ncbi:MAG: ABC transporter permease [Nitrospiraceae bacterium]|nr:ABC transporter permease [Nitrospiraceae bacterium]
MDKFLNIISQSVVAVRAFKLRTFFCMFSVALGISAITIIVAATEGAYKKAYDIVARFGPDSLLVTSGGEEARAVGRFDKTLTLGDVEAVKQNFDTAYVVVPMSAVRNINVSYRDKKYQTTIYGSTNDYSRVWTWPVIQGSDFTDEDVNGLRNVAIIGKYVVEQLFGNEDPVGKYILVKNIPVQVVGVLSERGTTPTGANLDDRIVIPITTLMRKLQNETTYISTFRIRFTDQERLEQRQEEMKQFLRARHNLRASDPDDFRIVSPKEIIKFLVALTSSLTIFLGVAGVISLFVAGFVLANLFLLSVKERSKEIGIRRAAGAKKRDILMQFLGEAVIITTIGGLIGFIMGYVSSNLLKLIAEFEIYFSWKAFAAGLLLSWAVGVGFGLQPARKAANMNPIDAIRK